VRRPNFDSCLRARSARTRSVARPRRPFSTQAAYAAPLILLAQTRQADRDKIALDQLEAHREEVMHHMQLRETALKKETDELKALLTANTSLTQQDKELTEKIESLTREIHASLKAG